MCDDPGVRGGPLALVVVGGLACQPPALPPVAAHDAAPAPEMLEPSPEARIVATVDPSIDPCEDFYHYACRVEEEGEVRWQMRQRMEAAQEAWLAESELGVGKGRTVRRFHADCLDWDAREAAGLRALEPLFAEIDAVVDARSFLGAAGVLLQQGFASVLAADRRPGNAGGIERLHAADLQLPDSTQIAELLQDPDVAPAVVEFAAAITDAPPDPDARAIVYFTRWEQVQWAAFRDAIRPASVLPVEIADAGYLDRVVTLAEQTPPAVLRAYLRVAILVPMRDALPPSRRPRRAAAVHLACIETARAHPSFAQGFGEHFLGRDGRQRAMNLVAKVRQAALARVETRPWPSPAVRAAAMRRLVGERMLVGWSTDARGPVVSPTGDHLANAIALHLFEQTAKPARRVNDLIVPLVVAQPPLWNLEGPDWANLTGFGTAAATTVLFPLGGYRGDGPFLLDADRELVKAVQGGQRCLEEAYAAAGIPTLGAPIDELYIEVAAVSVAYEAFREALPDPPPHGGIGADQLFFVGAVRQWCHGGPRDAIAPDDPNAVRINAIAAALPELARAFSCDETRATQIRDGCDTW